MRVPKPAAGMMTVTFIRGEKYNNSGERIAEPLNNGDSRFASGGCAGSPIRGRLLCLSGKHIAQRPLDSISSFLDNPDLLRLFFHVRRIKNLLQCVSHMMIHVGNNAHLAKQHIVAAQLVTEDQQPGQYSNEKIVNQSGHASDLKPAEDVLQKCSHKENGKPQQQTDSGASQ